MKNIIFLILLVTFTKVEAQEYRPFPTENARWVYYYSMEGLNYWTLYNLNGDTVINQKIYHVIHKKGSFGPKENLNILEDIYLREEDKRIYFINTLDKEKEILTYDFNLAVGDTFYLESFDTLVVKDERFEDGKRKLFLECLNLEYLGVKILDIWIEGIGSDYDLEKPTVYSSLMCFKGDNDQTDHCSYFDKILTDSQSYPVESKPIIYPNPAFKQLYFNIDNSKFNQYKIVDLNGKLMEFEKIDKNCIDISDFPEGIYLIQFIGDELTISDKFEKRHLP